MSVFAEMGDFSPLLDKYDVHGPRYTSYPTALQFTEEFTQADYAEQAQASNQLPLPKPLSIYIHIPFCKSLCYYCGCNKIVTQKESVAADYLDYLFQEIAMQSRLFAGDRLVQQIHFGGGTPTFLTTSQLREVMEMIAQSFHLGLPDTLEMGIEIDPRTVDVNYIRALTEMGFNRFSIGVQDFDTQVQKAINREQSDEQIVQLLNSAREQSVQSISLDVIYGLPKQTVEGFQSTLDRVIDIRPDRISLYNYAHMPQRIPAQRLILADDLPRVEEKLTLFTESIKQLTAAGYVYIGMDHFALPSDSLVEAMNEGGLHRNFQGYSTHAECDVIGIGVSSISKVNNSFSQNVTELSKYKDALEKERFPIKRGVNLSVDDQIRADLIQQIMCEGRINFREFGDSHDIYFKPYFAEELDSLDSFVQDGIIDLNQEGFVVTQKGRIFLRNIAMIFDAYLAQSKLSETEQPRYSKVL